MQAGKKNYDHLIKIIIIGDSSVGKSCILLRFSEDQFLDAWFSILERYDLVEKSETSG